MTALLKWRVVIGQGAGFISTSGDLFAYHLFDSIQLDTKIEIY